MPLLKFNGVYLLTTPPGLLRSADIVVGMRQDDEAAGSLSEGTKLVRLEWLSISGSGMGGHTIDGVPLREGSIVDVQVTSWTGWEKAQPAVFRFEPLTHELFTKLGEAGWIHGYLQLQKRLTDDNLVRNYFNSLYVWDSWEESPQ